MNKQKIIVPAGIRYMSDWSELDNGYHLEDYQFPHILDKQITGCGFTEYCLRNNLNIVLCSPRKVLLENKKDQHSNDINIVHFKWEDGNIQFDKDISGIRKRITPNNPLKNFISATQETIVDPESASEKEKKLLKLRQETSDKISFLVGSGIPCKILVTYDSFRHVRDILTRLGLLSSFYIVIDEFQSVMVDSRFKSEAELGLLYELRDINKLCYVSATPMMDKYLDMMDEFKDLPYFILDWVSEQPGRVVKPDIDAKPCKSITAKISKIIDSYRTGNFKKSVRRDSSGKLYEVESREAVIYINSVKNICDIIRRNLMSPDEVNVLCSRTPENANKIRKAFKEVNESFEGGIGTVPKRGEPHKMFTLCTRTVYLGADFYSTNARTFIFSDANIDCLSVDITLDLQQIIGRQRLIENPWKNHAKLYYKTANDTNLDGEAFNDYIIKKKERSSRLLDIYYNTTSAEDRHELAKTFQNSLKFDSYRSDYISVNSHMGADLVPVINNLVMISEIRAFEMQQIEYRDRANVSSALSRDYNVRQDEIDKKYSEIMGQSRFEDRMKLICSTGFDEDTQMALLDQLPMEFSNFYLALGPERCKALRYRQDSLQDAYKEVFRKQAGNLYEKIVNTFIIGQRYTKANIKRILQQFYLEIGLVGKPTANLLEEVFELKTCNIPDPTNPSKRDKGFEIIRLK